MAVSGCKKVKLEGREFHVDQETKVAQLKLLKTWVHGMSKDAFMTACIAHTDNMPVCVLIT